MDRIGIWINESKPEAIPLAQELNSWLSAKGLKVLSDWETIKEQGVDFLISLGGDGTLLEAAREAASYGIPVLGVNLGKLGFLCEIERGELFPAIEKVFHKEYFIEERLMLQAVVIYNHQKITRLALNDVVFMRNGKGVITLQADLSGEPAISYPADGLIVSTPTGSTAYSLSAGGPIMSPDVQAIALTPLAAHSLSARSMIVAGHEKIEIYMPNKGESCSVAFDGGNEIILRAGEKVQITASPLKALLIRLGMRHFQKVVREKLRDR